MMAYIVHLINVMRRVFKSHMHGDISEELLKTIVDDYEGSNVKSKIDSAVADFTRHRDIWKAGKDIVFEEITRLITSQEYIFDSES
jgi:hypothetical protein